MSEDRKPATIGTPQNSGKNRTSIRYLLAGGWNTLFGYFVGPIIYYGLEGRMHVVLVGIIAYVLSITMAFFTYKVFVFRTKGNWLAEYCRSYMVYGVTAVIGIGVLWGLVDGLKVPFWIGQGLVIIVTTIISYLSHSRFTFSRPSQ
jgi:putative flippase GtrA